MFAELAELFPEMKDRQQLRAVCEKSPITRRTVIFCMTARVGSTALLSLISNNYGFPYIEETFNGRDVAPAIARANSIKTFADYLAHVNAMAPEGMLFAFKTNWGDFEWCAESGCIDILFPNASYIYLDRINIDAQAVSLYCASQSGRWHNFVGEKFERSSEIPYDKRLIDEAVWVLGQEKLKWQRFFGTRGIMPTTIFYESIVRSPKAAIKRLIRDLELKGEPIAEWSGAIVEKIDDPQQLKILDRYRNERYAGVLGAV